MIQNSHHRLGVSRVAGLLATTCLISVIPSFASSGAASAAPPAVSSASASSDALAPVAVLALQQLTTYLGSRDLADLAGYRVTRASIAAEVGRRLLIDADRLDAAWAATDYVHQTALLAAFTQLGTPYRRNTSKPGVGFDCSGLTTYAWGMAGVRLTRQSSAQINAAVPRTLESAEAGDLVQYPGHVMMYLGLDKAIVHAIQPGRPVEVDYIAKRRELRFGHPV